MLKEEGHDIDFDIIKVDSQEKAEELRFVGSPTIKIDGKDVDPAADRLTNYIMNICRTYCFNDKIYDFPPKEMIKLALRDK